jgi:UDP-N-acetylglucosamine 1-carboxyvinyltransferase
MDKIIIRGGQTLQGSVRISGAKNATLPILAATLLAPGEHQLCNLPDLLDVSTMLSLMGRLGCPSLVGDGAARIDTSRLIFCEAPYDLVRKMRASVLVLGPLLARRGSARVSLPGGCAIGVRPIDQHLKGLEALGCEFELADGYVHGTARRLRGARITLDVPTVTGTENLMMAAVLARGETVIENAAREPEIVDLACFLRSLGARIQGEGSERLTIQGVDTLRPAPTPYSILPDRIEAGTYLAAGAITGGDVTVTHVRPDDLGVVLRALRAAGCEVESGADWVRVRRDGPLRPLDITTEPHPGFPTDMQAQVMALSALAGGTSRIRETIFENRFMHVPELARMGAQIEIRGNTATVSGVATLQGASVMATDLRASASLVLAGLAAEGHTEVLRLHHLDRGYEHLVEKLRGLGAAVARAPEERGDLGGVLALQAVAK